MVAPGGLTTRQHSGIAVQELGSGDFEIRMAALDEAEVERAITSIWPDAIIVAIGAAVQSETACDQPRSSAKQAERMPGSLMA